MTDGDPLVRPHGHQHVDSAETIGANSSEDEETSPDLLSKAENLAASLKAIFEAKGAEGVKGYIEAALAGTAENMPSEERLVIFEVLASTQERKLLTKAGESGETMLQDLVDKTKESGGSLTDKNKAAVGTIGSIEKGYSETVTQPLNRTSEKTDRAERVRQRERIIEAIAQLGHFIPEGMKKVYEYIDEFEEWAGADELCIEDFFGQYHSTQLKIRFIEKAKKSITSTSENKRDHSDLIDPDVLSGITQNVVESVREGDTDGDLKVVLSHLIEPSVDSAAHQRLKHLMEVASEYYTSFIRYRSTLRTKIEEADAGLRSLLHSEGGDMQENVDLRIDVWRQIHNHYHGRINQFIEQAASAIEDSKAFLQKVADDMPALQNQRLL